MDKIIAFSHIMKTGGTTLGNMLIGHYGIKAHHIWPDHLSLEGKPYTYDNLSNDLKIFKNLKVIQGHALRPFIDFKEYEDNLFWMTILRDPIQRYVSHYVHDIYWGKRIKQLEDKSIQHWNEKYDRSNMMVKFISGSDDLEAAKRILIQKFQFVGILEEFEKSLCIFKNSAQIKQLNLNYQRPKNPSYNPSIKKIVLNESLKFIEEQNQLDSQLYEYALHNIWPAQIEKFLDNCNKNGNPRFIRPINTLLYQIKRQRNYNTVKINQKSIRKFIRRM